MSSELSLVRSRLSSLRRSPQGSPTKTGCSPPLTSAARDRVNRSRVVVQGDGDGPTGAVTGIGIRTEGTRSHLFASTSTQARPALPPVPASPRLHRCAPHDERAPRALTPRRPLRNPQVVGCELGTSSPKLAVLDAHGCAALCACSSGAQEFVVGRSEGVYFYGSEGREQCLAFPGEKRQLSAFGGYLMVLASGPPGTVASSQARAPQGRLSAPPVRRGVSGLGVPSAARAARLCVRQSRAPVLVPFPQISLYDLRNKLIAYQSQQAHGRPCLARRRRSWRNPAALPPLLRGS